MIICNNCGVELEPDMDVCPLCQQPVSADVVTDRKAGTEKQRQEKPASTDDRTMSKPQRKAVWELVSIILILLVVATSLINFIINKAISWSEYPVAICLIIFSYVSSFALVNKRREAQLSLAFVASSLFILVLDHLTGGRNWAFQLGIPLLFFANIILIGFLAAIRLAKQRGINLIAFAFLAAALLCLATEVIADLYIKDTIDLVWSLIVSACVILVAAVLLFMHYRLKKGRDLNKTFHI